MNVGQIIVAILCSFRYYEGTCFITVKDSAGVAHQALLGASTTYDFATMMSLRKQAVKCSLEYVGTVPDKKDSKILYERFKFLGFDLE
jgi:hypothetical protein